MNTAILHKSFTGLANHEQTGLEEGNCHKFELNTRAMKKNLIIHKKEKSQMSSDVKSGPSKRERRTGKLFKS